MSVGALGPVPDRDVDKEGGGGEPRAGVVLQGHVPEAAAEEGEGLDPGDKEEVDIAEGEQDTEEAATDKSVQLKSQQSLTRRVCPQSIDSSFKINI